MRFHGIEMKGKFTNQKVADASALVHQASDEGRTLYDETTDEMFFADSSDFYQLISTKSIGSYEEIPSGTAMWFYEDSAPTGWTISAAAEDAILAVKYAAGGTWTTGGTIQGTWTLPIHAHSVYDHNHRWKDYQAVNTVYTFDAAGNPINMRLGEVNNTNGLCVNVTSGNPVTSPYDGWTELDGANSTTADTGGTTFRPRSHVGIICTKD